MVRKWIAAIFNIRKLRQILKGIKNIICGNNVVLGIRRKAICRKCEYKKVICNASFCKICGCSIKIKTRVEDGKCPMNKW